MSSFKLQTVLWQLSGLTPAELSEVKAAVHEELERQLRALGAKGDLTEEEWERLEGDGLFGCVKMVCIRTGLGLVEAKAYVDRARAKGRRPGASTPSGDSPPAARRQSTAFEQGYGSEGDDSGAGLQRGSEGHTLYCPRGCCDTGQDFGNGGRWEGSK